MIYSIYHPVGGSMNHECRPGAFMYEKVFTVEAVNIEQAFVKAQNDFNKEYAALGYRSTSVGDIIQSQDDYDNCRCKVVQGLGYMDCPDTWLSFVDWGAIEGAPDDWNEPDNGFHRGMDRDGNAGLFEDYEQSIGEA